MGSNCLVAAGSHSILELLVVVEEEEEKKKVCLQIARIGYDVPRISEYFLFRMAVLEKKHPIESCTMDFNRSGGQIPGQL